MHADEGRAVDHDGARGYLIEGDEIGELRHRHPALVDDGFLLNQRNRGIGATKSYDAYAHEGEEDIEKDHASLASFAKMSAFTTPASAQAMARKKIEKLVNFT